MRKALLMWLVAAVSGCVTQNPTTPPSSGPTGPATNLGTFLLTGAMDPRLPAPGEEAKGLTPEDRELLASAGHMPGLDTSSNPAVFWNQVTAELGSAAHLSPPLFARNCTYVQVGIFDALAVAHDFRRNLPDHAVSAGVAFEVLRALFPGDAARILSEAATQAAIDRGPFGIGSFAGWVFGRAVGRLFVWRGQHDGSDAVYTGTPPTGDGIWTGTNPMLPMCGTWRTWILNSGGEFVPEPPYPFGSADDLREVQEVLDVLLHRTPEQVAIVHMWADLSPPTIWNRILNEQIESHGLSALAAARAHAYLNATMADGFIACWKCKYTFWIARPFQRIPGLVTVIPTPNFPGYISGHSTISAAAAEVMSELFPAESAWFREQAEEAAMSRLWGGIHFTHDNNQGLVIGRQVGAKAVSRMQHDQGLML